MTKYILIPEYAPLYAMHSCFGPEHGPLTQPTRTPIDVIGGLLQQTGREKVTVYEVIPSVKPNTFSAPVQLTLDNYRLPYEQIADIPPVDEAATVVVSEPVISEPVVTEPVVVPSSPVVDEPENSVVETTEDENKNDDAVVKNTAPETPVEEVSEEVAAEEPVTEATEEKVVVESQPNPYAGMTKAERRAARRAAAQAEAEKIAASDATTFEDEPVSAE